MVVFRPFFEIELPSVAQTSSAPINSIGPRPGVRGDERSSVSLALSRARVDRSNANDPSPAARNAEVMFWDNFGTKRRTKRGKTVFRYTITSVMFQCVRKDNQMVKLDLYALRRQRSQVRGSLALPIPNIFVLLPGVILSCHNLDFALRHSSIPTAPTSTSNWSIAEHE